MGRPPCFDKNVLKRGPWTPEEDRRLVDYINKNNGYGNWRTLPTNAGLQRCGKSCRLRWTNYLRPDIKRGGFSIQEEDTIIHLHSILGNKWSAIAAKLPGRTDNEIKNYWNTHIRKKLLRMGIDPVTHTPRLHLLHLSRFLNSSSSPDQIFLSSINDPQLVTGFTMTPQSQDYFTDIRNPNQIPHPYHNLQTLEQDQLTILDTLLEFDHNQAHHVKDQRQQDNEFVPNYGRGYGNLMDDPNYSSLDGLSFNQFNSSTSNFDVFQCSLSSPSSSPVPFNSNSSYYSSSSVMDFQIADFMSHPNIFM